MAEPGERCVKCRSIIREEVVETKGSLASRFNPTRAKLVCRCNDLEGPRGPND